MEVKAEIELLRTVTEMLERKVSLINKSEPANINNEVNVVLTEDKKNDLTKGLYVQLTEAQYRKLNKHAFDNDITFAEWVRTKISEI